MCDMTAKSVIRSIRFDADTNLELEAQARAAGKTVSEYIRWVVADVAARESRVAGHRRAMVLFAELPQLDDPDATRAAMWGIDARVPD